MAVNMVKEPTRRRGNWRAPVGAAVVLLLALAVVAQLDGLRGQVGASFWRATLLAPAVVVYILAIRPSFDRFRDDAARALRGLAADPAAFDRVVAAGARTRGRDWASAAAGAVAAIALLQPWRTSGDFPWTLGYRVGATVLMGALTGYAVYLALSGTRLLTALHHQPLRVNVFDPVPLEPVARRSLNLSLCFLGGISIGVVLIPDQDALGLALTGTITAVAVAVFYLGLRNTHLVLVEAKQRELAAVRRHLNTVYGEVKDKTGKGEYDDLGRFNTLTNVWGNYEKRIKEAPEWPFTNSMLRRLYFTTLIPLVLLSSQRVVAEAVIKVLGVKQ